MADPARASDARKQIDWDQLAPLLGNRSIGPADKWAFAWLWRAAGNRPGTVVVTASALGAFFGASGRAAWKWVESLKKAGLVEEVDRDRRRGSVRLYVYDPAEDIAHRVGRSDPQGDLPGFADEDSSPPAGPTSADLLALKGPSDGPFDVQRSMPAERPGSLLEAYRAAIGEGEPHGNPNPVKSLSVPERIPSSRQESKSSQESTRPAPRGAATPIGGIMPSIVAAIAANSDPLVIEQRLRRDLRAVAPDVSEAAIRRVADLLDDGLDYGAVTKGIRDFREIDGKNSAKASPTQNRAGLLIDCIDKRVRAAGQELAPGGRYRADPGGRTP